MREADYTRESKNARERDCKGKTRNTRQDEGKCETVHKDKHKNTSVSEMEHSKHKHMPESTSTLMRKHQHLNTTNLSDDRFI